MDYLSCKISFQAFEADPFGIFFFQGKGEFTMEYLEHSQVAQDVQTQLVNSYKATKSLD